jgi:hypothetical protein
MITERGTRSCELRRILLSHPAWRCGADVRVYIVRCPGDVDVWDAWGDLWADTGSPAVSFHVAPRHWDEDVETEDNDAIALAVCRWCLAEFATLFLALVDAGEEVVRPGSWSRVLSPEV